MHVLRLATQNFRNLEDAELFPCDRVNVIYGDNAQGKTNLLESLWMFTGGHSFRGAREAEMPRFSGEPGVNLPAASLALDFFSEGREQKAVLNIEEGKKTSVINGVRKNTGAALVGKVPAVIFSPEHLLLVKEGPARRRSFVDGALCQIRPSYAGLLSAYNRALQQRNALLKDISRFPELMETLLIWNQRLAKLGAAVIAERVAYVRKISPQAGDVYHGISKGRETIRIEYSPTVKFSVESFSEEETEAAFLQELARTEQSDLRSGFTSAGPHRDDLEILLNGVSARAYGSQGQQRSTVLALKLAEAELLAKGSGEAPMVLLDDVMSELDQSRQDYLLNHLHGRQVFITCCSPETVSLLETGRRFRVEAGKIFPE